jgi:hypothetical protein
LSDTGQNANLLVYANANASQHVAKTKQDLGDAYEHFIKSRDVSPRVRDH